jgi:hypothetical protein
VALTVLIAADNRVPTILTLAPELLNALTSIKRGEVKRVPSVAGGV